MHLLLFVGSQVSIYEEILLDANKLKTTITNAPTMAITERMLLMENINSYSQQPAPKLTSDINKRNAEKIVIFSWKCDGVEFLTTKLELTPSKFIDS